MDARGLIIVFGSLGIAIVAIVVGYCIHDSTAASLLRIFGILGVIAWVFFAFYLANAMNTDI